MEDNKNLIELIENHEKINIELKNNIKELVLNHYYSLINPSC